MSADFGSFSQIVPAAASLLAAAGALILTFKGRANWEPAQEDVPLGAQRLGGMLTAVAIAGIYHQFVVKGGSPDTLELASWTLAVFAVVFLLLYAFLIGLLTFDKIVALPDNKTETIKIIGGFRLTPKARELVAQGNPVKTIFAAAYEEDLVWERGSRAAAKAVFLFVYVALVATGTSAITSSAILVSAEPSGRMEAALDAWIDEAEKARKARTVSRDSALPSSTAAARARFEETWQNASLGDRRKLDQEKVSKGLSHLNRIYRLQEHDSPTQRNALFWADTAIRHFEETQQRENLANALVDKCAIYLALSQLQHTNKDDFLNLSKSGDATITRALSIANDDLKDEILRISSRFYYNLARPASFRMSDAWDNTYLLLSYQRAAEAYELKPRDSRNASQLLRAAMKASRNPPQDSDPAWASKLRAARDAMARAWNENKQSLTSVEQRLSPLNVLGTATVETVARQWHDTAISNRPAAAKVLLIELEQDGLASLREAIALLQNDALKREYSYDLYYDLARGHAQRVVMLRVTDKAAAAAAFRDAQDSMAQARQTARAAQVDAAIASVGTDPTLAKLGNEEKAKLVKVLKPI